MSRVRCPKCGAENYAADPVCLSCGERLGAEAHKPRPRGVPASAPQAETPLESKAAGAKPLGLALLIVGLLVLVIPYVIVRPPLVTNRGCDPNIVAPGDQFEARLETYLDSSLGGDWEASGCYFAPDWTDTQKKKGLSAAYMTAQPARETGVSEMYLIPSDLPQTLRVYARVDVPKDKRLAGEVVRGVMHMPVRYPVIAGTNSFEVKSTELKTRLAFRVCTPEERTRFRKLRVPVLASMVLGLALFIWGLAWAASGLAVRRG